MKYIKTTNIYLRDVTLRLNCKKNFTSLKDCKFIKMKKLNKITPFLCYNLKKINNYSNRKPLKIECPKAVESIKFFIIENICFYEFRLNYSLNAQYHDKFCRKSDFSLFSPYTSKQIMTIIYFLNLKLKLTKTPLKFKKNHLLPIGLKKKKINNNKEIITNNFDIPYNIIGHSFSSAKVYHYY